MKRQLVAIAASASLIGGCAGLPDVKVGHYLPQGALSASVVRTIGCATRPNVQTGQSEKKLFAAATATMKMSYERDPNGYRSTSIKQFGSGGKSATLGFTYYDDGRLKGMNSTSTGSGQEITEAAVKLTGIVLGIAGVGLAAADSPACLLVAEQSAKDAPLTLSYTFSEAFTDPAWASGTARELQFKPSQSNPNFSLDINPALPTLCAVVGPVTKLEALVQPVEGNADAATSISLRQPAAVAVQIVQENGDAFLKRRHNMADISPTHPCGDNPEVLTAGVVLVPQLGNAYYLPIPKGAFFGSTAFEMSLAESGSLTGVKYGNTGGGAAALSAGSAVAGMFTPDDAATRAGKKKSDADLIYQQQRLVSCQMTPATCPKE